MKTYMLLIALHKLSILAGMYAVWVGYDRWIKASAAGRLWRLTFYTFFIFVFHEPMSHLFTGITFMLAGRGAVIQLTAYLLIPTLTILICVGVAELLRLWAPAAYYLLTGGRGNKEKSE
jgi:hypothetical protein